MAVNPLRELEALGQSVWLDDIHRGMLDDGGLVRLIEQDGLAGVTSNPAIFAAAITTDAHYADALTALLRAGRTSVETYEALAIEDVGRAADLFRGVYERAGGRDGFVSMEVSPRLAYDTEGSIAEAQRLWRQLNRPNVMIKIPGTEPGLIAIRELIANGVNVNVTLLFLPERYRGVAVTYCDGLEKRLARGEGIDRIASVASFFLSRIDALVDPLLDDLMRRGQRAAQSLRGKAAIACACGAYAAHRETISSERWHALAARGANPQRLLWASTSTKDPAYNPIKYVEELIAANTVTTLPLETLALYRRLGRPELRLKSHIAQASDERAALERLGIDLDGTAGELERQGVSKFVEPFERLQRWLEEQRLR